jgi:uncharacterized coiled-coil protein SlyX
MKNKRREREVREELARLTKSSLSNDPELIYTPETPAEMYYFKKYQQMHRLAKSQEDTISQLNEKIRSQDQTLGRNQTKIKEMGQDHAELLRKMKIWKTRYRAACDEYKKETGKEFTSLGAVSDDVEPIKAIPLYDSH